MSEPNSPPQKSFRRRLRARWKHTPLNPYWLAHKLLWESIGGYAGRLRGDMLDIGCENRQYKSLLTGISHYWGIEHPGAASNIEDDFNVSFKRAVGLVDVFGDAETLPFASDLFDSCFCAEVLEHVPHPQLAVAEMYRVMKPGALALVTVPLVNEIHQAPYDFSRFTHFGLRAVLESAGFVVEELHPRGNTASTVGVVVSHALLRLGARSFTRDGAPSTHPAVALFLFPICAFVQVTSRWLGMLRRDDGYCVGYVALARKPLRG